MGKPTQSESIVRFIAKLTFAIIVAVFVGGTIGLTFKAPILGIILGTLVGSLIIILVGSIEEKSDETPNKDNSQKRSSND